MKKENFSKLSTEDLIKKKKTTKFVTAGILAGVLVLLLIFNMFRTINEGFTPLLIVPFALLPILFLSYNSASNINKELESRKSNRQSDNKKGLVASEIV